MKNKLSVQVLISTMHQSDYSLLEIMNIQTNAIVVNQCNENKTRLLKLKDKKVLWIDTSERGLSRSRNMAMRNATGDICILADDDEEFCDGYGDIVKTAFSDHQFFSIIRFRIQGIEKKFKNYPSKEYSIGYIKSLKISSVELAFRRKDVVTNGIFFDELIGSGTEFLMGEENAFIYQCLLKKMKVLYVPKTLANLHIGNSSWFDGFNIDYFVGRGAAFTAMSKRMSKLLILQFAIRKFNLYKNDIGFIASIHYMMQGRKKYLSQKQGGRWDGRLK
ncbi:MAG: glycosyltransferase family 2 protein [Lachnospiraceae bacterium]|nr:glycosyltransferase family 2 protein [Lachnospiraceae bacterium]